MATSPLSPVLKRGSRGNAVSTLQALLQSQGFYPYRIDTDFGPRTESGVSYFQSTHLGPDGRYLEVTGKVDEATWWALRNPSGDPQRSHLDPRIPRGLSEPRKQLLQLCVREHRNGVREIPDGANYGDGVSKYLDAVGTSKAVGANFWCAFCVSYLHYESTGAWLTGARQGSCHMLYKAALKAGIAFPKSSGRVPLPGDVFIILFGSPGDEWRSGHTGFVGSVSASGAEFNTWAGNEGNRFKYGVRSMGQSTLVGFISPFGEDCKPQRLLVDASASSDSVSGTR